MTVHSIVTTCAEGVVLIYLNRPEVRRTLDERMPAFEGR
jgi:hypothetical protein